MPLLYPQTGSLERWPGRILVEERTGGSEGEKKERRKRKKEKTSMGSCGSQPLLLFPLSNPDSSAPKEPHIQAKELELSFRLKQWFRILHFTLYTFEIAQNEKKKKKVRFQD